MTREAFLARFGPVFENRPDLAEAVWAGGPDCRSAEALQAGFVAVLRSLRDEALTAFLNGHPDLAGALLARGAVTADSAKEQGSAGLDALDAAGRARFLALNAAYRARFGFPFIMAVRGRSAAEILACFEVRLGRDAATERTEAVRQIDAIFVQEAAINGQSAERRLAWRQEHVLPLVTAFEDWLRRERPRLSRHAEVAKAMDYMLKRWPAFARFLDDGRICLSNNTAERALRGVALGRKSWLFCGSDRGGRRAAAMYTLIGTARLNNLDPQAWLADVLERIADQPVRRLHELLPWNWQPSTTTPAA